MGIKNKMAAMKLTVLFIVLYIVKIQLVMAQVISGPCGSSCGYGYNGYYPTVYDTSNNDPLDVIIPILLLAIYNRAGGGVRPHGPFHTGNGGTAASSIGCDGGCGGGCGGGGGGCGSGCDGGCGGGRGGRCGGGCGGGCSCGSGGGCGCGSSCGSGCNNGCGGGCGCC